MIDNNSTLSKNDKNILIISCDSIFCETVKMRLQSIGCKSKSIHESDISKTLIDKFEPDLILYDLNKRQEEEFYQMSDDNILSALNESRTIYFATKQDIKFKWFAISKGSAGFIEKPYPPDELLSQIENALLFKSYN